MYRLMKFITALLIGKCVQKENGHTIAQTRKDIEEKLALLEGKNSYWHNFQKDDVVEQKIERPKYVICVAFSVSGSNFFSTKICFQ